MNIIKPIVKVRLSLETIFIFTLLDYIFIIFYDNTLACFGITKFILNNIIVYFNISHILLFVLYTLSVLYQRLVRKCVVSRIF